ncbi:RDD family protein [Clostridium peptidivorans]|uniref:RDD family protein n=1 Tax=Clostridium peptidivorans TaxID=100174 RepID=UPI000BE35485|nr:RDD family protein [Clostridium peptidivorans]
MENGTQNNNVEEVKDTGNIKFSNLISASITDTAIMLIISGVLFFVLQVTLRLAGYNILKPYIGAFVLIIFVIVSILYSPIIRGKKGATIGEKGSELKVVKKETVQ